MTGIPAKCFLCEGTRSQVVSDLDRHGKPLRTRLCLDCGLVFNDPIPSDDEIREFYETRYRLVYKGRATPRRRQIVRNFRRALQHINHHRNIYEIGGRLLDVGAGSGEFLFLARSIGWSVTGIEPDISYAEYCRNVLDLEVVTADIHSVSFAPGLFHLIRLNHVLEHIDKPIRALRTLSSWLTEDGLVYVEVPNIEVDAASMSYGNLFHYGHIFNFNAHTLRAVAGLSGLSVYADSCRSGESTRLFLTKGAARKLDRISSISNAERVKRAIDNHYAKKHRLEIGKVGRNLSQRCEEIWSGIRLGPPNSIAAKFAEKLAS